MYLAEYLFVACWESKEYLVGFDLDRVGCIGEQLPEGLVYVMSTDHQPMFDRFIDRLPTYLSLYLHLFFI